MRPKSISPYLIPHVIAMGGLLALGSGCGTLAQATCVPATEVCVVLPANCLDACAHAACVDCGNLACQGPARACGALSRPRHPRHPHRHRGPAPRTDEDWEEWEDELEDELEEELDEKNDRYYDVRAPASGGIGRIAY